MQKIFFGVLAASVLFLFPAKGFPQDVCCVLSKTAGLNVTTMATIRSSDLCRGGTSDGGFKICRGFADPDNLCSTTPLKRQCEMCGNFWSGSECMTEDPVKKAQKELQKKNADVKAGANVQSVPPPPPPEASPTPAPESQEDQGPAPLPLPE